MWSAYLQQQRALTAEGINTCPREQLRIDLKEEITRWTIAGDPLIIIGDWNEDIRDQSEWFEAQGLREAILEQHGADQAQATFHRTGTHRRNLLLAIADTTCIRILGI